jgi:hypothetical protein
MPEHVSAGNNFDSSDFDLRLTMVERGLSDLRDQFALWMKKIQE